MKRWINSLVVGLAVLAVSVAATAAPADAQEVSRSVMITRDTKIGGQAVTKGEYSLKFVEGKDGQLVVLKGKREVAKSSYKMTNLDRPAADNSVIYTASDDGSFLIKRIEFKGKSAALVLE
jgi:hypothetical protein